MTRTDITRHSALPVSCVYGSLIWLNIHIPVPAPVPAPVPVSYPSVYSCNLYVGLGLIIKFRTPGRDLFFMYKDRF